MHDKARVTSGAVQAAQSLYTSIIGLCFLMISLRAERLATPAPFMISLFIGHTLGSTSPAWSVGTKNPCVRFQVFLRHVTCHDWCHACFTFGNTGKCLEETQSCNASGLTLEPNCVHQYSASTATATQLGASSCQTS